MISRPRLRAAFTAFAALPAFLLAGPPAPAFADPAPGSSESAPAFLAGPHGETPTQWGAITVPLGGRTRSAAAPRTVEDIGGGTWNYGTTSADSLNKTCYSNYIHPTREHSSTAIMASGNIKGSAKPGVWSKASVTAGAAHTCYAYWAVY